MAFTEAQLQSIQNLIDLKNQIKELETKEKELVKEVKQYMKEQNLTEYITPQNKKVSVITSYRRTVSKATKDEFIGILVSQGYQNLIKHEIAPNVDSIFAEVNAGKISADFVNQYIKTSDIVTLKVSDA